MDKLLLLSGIEEIEQTLKIIQILVILGTITFFASHLTIITQLPKIRRYLEEICFETEEEEEKFKEKQSKENMLSLILFVILGIAISIFIMCMFL